MGGKAFKVVNTFQNLYLTLQKFWHKKGCCLLHPCDVPVGAATFHPEVLFPALGKKPWRAAFMQACRRPGDGRFGDNPNRLQKFHQFQVLLKPIPEEVKSWMLESFVELGIPVHQCDIRFVEDNWESPTLGAQGLGWEVWINGMEVLQFTYFQKIGGYECRPASVELAYGMERIALVQQNKKNVFDLAWNQDPGLVTYRDLFLHQEKEFSRYYFEHTCPLKLTQNFHYTLEQAGKILAEGMMLPAYELCMQGSHLFNMLEASGTLSVVQKGDYILKIRELVHACCTFWIEKEACDNC
ncbi:glycine--tRNA ligase alpha subunit [Holospora elegans E1]|uniref:Glycine--tRNA ligase alpha subunit n=1 Tax=Holospora elegans E1 TaxID=1427503 RepID=A0A023DX86_9PROT|nr:glycine--tRNA ligase subunit alpha [Holospora elegans]GAJ45958.1 glycine--tRNA ligase alpha subunit [Holospora elegans E1]